MTLDQHDDDVTGSGTQRDSRDPRSIVVEFTVSGTAKDDDVAFTMTGDFFGADYQAKLDGDTMSGTWDTSLVSAVVTLHRQ